MNEQPAREPNLDPTTETERAKESESDDRAREVGHEEERYEPDEPSDDQVADPAHERDTGA